MTSTPILEAAAKEFAGATANPPYLFDLGPDKGREVVDEVQSGAIAAPDVDITDLTVPGGPSGSVSVRIVRPPNSTAKLPVIVYIHGAGWVFGNAHTHDRLIRELAVGSSANAHALRDAASEDAVRVVAVAGGNGSCPRRLPSRAPAGRPPLDVGGHWLSEGDLFRIEAVGGTRRGATADGVAHSSHLGARLRRRRHRRASGAAVHLRRHRPSRRVTEPLRAILRAAGQDLVCGGRRHRGAARTHRTRLHPPTIVRAKC